MVTKTEAELAELTPAQRAAHFAAEEETVFGKGFQRDRHGQPIEQGIGSPGRESEHHWNALEKAEGKEVADRAREAAARLRQQ